MEPFESTYDRIGTAYGATRCADPRIARRIVDALGDARSVLNVGAGTGSYEPDDRWVVAVEPSFEMIRQRPELAAPAIQAVAEALPFGDKTFDACLAVLTLHHWSDRGRGLAEMQRVSRGRAVILTWDPVSAGAFWLTAEYFPEILALDVPRFPTIEGLSRCLGSIEVLPVLIPHDCRDGFLGAYWARPEAYLDAAVRQGMSAFPQIDPTIVEAGLKRLSDDLSSGRWDGRWGYLRQLTEIDLGYRLVVAGHGPGRTYRRAGAAL